MNISIQKSKGYPVIACESIINQHHSDHQYFNGNPKCRQVDDPNLHHFIGSLHWLHRLGEGVIEYGVDMIYAEEFSEQEHTSKYDEDVSKWLEHSALIEGSWNPTIDEQFQKEV